MYGVDQRTVTRWQNRAEDPLPVDVRGKRGQPNRYNISAVHEWGVRQRLSDLSITDDGGVINFEAERARLTKEQADERAMKNAVLRQELAPVAALTDALTKVAGQINAIFDSIPLKVKNRLPHLGASEVEIITRELVKAQNAASTVQLDISDLD